MILDDEHVATALAILRDSERVFTVHFNANNAEIDVDEAHARAYPMTNGTVGERDALTTLSPEVMRTRRELARASAEVKRLNTDLKGAEKTIDVWQTENANVRAMERVR